MKLRDLTDNELQTLIAICRLVINADGVVSEQEEVYLGGLKSAVGLRRWADLEAGIQIELQDPVDVIEEASGIRRPAVHTLMLGVLDGLARADGLVAEEEELLSWIRDAWHLGGLEAEDVHWD